MSKLIGIVGGLGPKAGENLHAAILSNTRAIKDSEHLPILLYTNPQIPDRTAYLNGEVPGNPAVEICASLEKLVEFGAEILSVPCNTAHSPAIWDEVEGCFAPLAEKATLLHIIRLTVEFLVHTHPSVSHVGILGTNGTASSHVYHSEIMRHNMHPIIPTEANQKRVQESIYHPDWGLKAQSSPPRQEATDALETAGLRMIADGAEAIILGCTEIPLALKEPTLKGIPLINSTAVLARACIRLSAGADKLKPLPR